MATIFDSFTDLQLAILASKVIWPNETGTWELGSPGHKAEEHLLGELYKEIEKRYPSRQKLLEKHVLYLSTPFYTIN